MAHLNKSLGMDIVEKNLLIIAECIRKNEYKEVETHRFELKDISANWGNDWYKTVCAFLNTNGGIILIGINDKNNAKPPYYKFTGYDNSDAREKHLKQDLPKKFSDKHGNILNLAHYISKFELIDFMGGKVAAVYVEELADDEKYVYYEGTAYRRKLTGDHALTLAEIESFEELKRDIVNSQELSIVPNVPIEVMNIDKLNQYIMRFNKGKRKGETLKTDLNHALSFLVRQNFVRDMQPTILGMLVCGDFVENYIQGKCEVDCYVLAPHVSKIAQSKEVINDNIIDLIERSFNFIWRNIQIGVTYANGGTAEPEYPEALIRESINNALAHRNYRNDRFVIIEIRPNESLMIRNPGMFERRQRIYLDTDLGKIRRIIPIQVARNPKLTLLLKIFDYWEGKGRGLTSLIDACLDNQIDVPYYVLSEGEIKLFIPTGKVYDEEMDIWLSSFAHYIVTKLGRMPSNDEKVMLSFFYKSERLNHLERYTILLTMDNNHNETIVALEENGLIFKNPSSIEIYPIYQVDRILMKKDFSHELRTIFGNEWLLLKPDSQMVLNAIYVHNEFASQTEVVSANRIGTFAYLNQFKKIDLNNYESFKRKIRLIFNQLEDKGFIVRKDGKSITDKGKPDFRIHKQWVAKPNLFQL